MSNVHKQISTLFQAISEQQKALQALNTRVQGLMEPMRNMMLVASVMQKKGIVTNEELTEMLAQLRAESEAGKKAATDVPVQPTTPGSDAGDHGNSDGRVSEGQGISGTTAEPGLRLVKNNPSNPTPDPATL